MAFEIVDGTGSGNRVNVGSDKHLRVQAKTHTKEHVASLNDGDGYLIHTGTTANTLTSTITGGPILYLSNTNTTQSIVVTDIHLFTDTAGVVFRLIKDPTLGTIGNNNVFSPVNLNFGSSKSASTTAYTWNEVGNGMTGLSGGTLFFPFLLPIGSFQESVEQMIVLPQGSSLSLEVIGAAEIAAALTFYFHPAE